MSNIITFFISSYLKASHPFGQPASDGQGKGRVNLLNCRDYSIRLVLTKREELEMVFTLLLNDQILSIL